MQLNEAQVWTMMGVFTAFFFSTLAVVSRSFVRILRAQIGGLRAEMNGRFEAMHARFEAIETCRYS